MSALQDFRFSFLPMQFINGVGILANLMLLIAFIKDPLKCFQNSATYLVGSLAFSDMLYSAVMMTMISEWFEDRNSVLYSLQDLSVCSSILAIFSIALDRYFIVTYPFKHRFLMSAKKMAIWIALIWLLSFIYLAKKIFMPGKENDFFTPVTCLFFIILTSLLYSKTYFALKKQAKSLIGCKITTQPRQHEHASKKLKSVERKAGAMMTYCGDVKTNVADKSSTLIESLDKSVQSSEKLGQLQKTLIQIQNVRIEHEIECTEIKNDEYVKGQNECVKSQDARVKRVQNQDGCVQNQDTCVNCKKTDAEYHVDLAGSQEECEEYQNERSTDHARREKTVGQILKRKDSSIQSAAKGEKTRSQESLNNSKWKFSTVIKNKQEQQFLNTILIIAVVAVITVVPAAITCQVWQMVVEIEENQRSTKIVFGVVWTTFSFNFAANPFIYCLRLKRYWKTFKIIYFCKN